MVRLNRVLFDPGEVQTIADGSSRCELPFADARSAHVAKTLRLADGDCVRVGVLDRGWTDEATVRWVWPAGEAGRWAWSDDTGRSSGTARTRALAQQRTWPTELQVEFGPLRAPLPRPRVDVLLAVPRPLQLQRMLPMVASIGVDNLILCGARKVEADYFGSHLFREPSKLHDLLVEGLAQSGDVHVPKVHVAKRLDRFLTTGRLDVISPPARAARLVAHPAALDSSRAPAPRMRELAARGHDGPGRVCLAVGPEGGWQEPDELELLAAHGFSAITLGPRILRSDTALNALLALAHDALCT